MWIGSFITLRKQKPRVDRMWITQLNKWDLKLNATIQDPKKSDQQKSIAQKTQKFLWHDNGKNHWSSDSKSKHQKRID